MPTQTTQTTAGLIGRAPQFADRVESGENLAAAEAEAAMNDRARAVIDGRLDVSEVERRVAVVVAMLHDLQPAAGELLVAWCDVDAELDRITASELDRLGASRDSDRLSDAIRDELVGRMLCGPSGPSAAANDIAAAITGEAVASS